MGKRRWFGHSTTLPPRFIGRWAGCGSLYAINQRANDILPPARHSLSEFQIPREGGSPIKTVYSSYVLALDFFRTKVLLEGESTNSMYDQIKQRARFPEVQASHGDSR